MIQAKDVREGDIIAVILQCNEARCDYDAISRERGWGAYHGGRPGCYLQGPYSAEDAERRAVVHLGDPPAEYEPHWANVMDLACKLDVPEKVLRAKLNRMIERGTIQGCACGCRGDLVVPGSLADVVFHFHDRRCARNYAT